MQPEWGTAPAWAEPEEWFLVFSTKAAASWIARLPFAGKYRHVSALGYVSRLECWVAVNVGLDRTQVCLLPDADGRATLADHLFACDVVRFPGGGLGRPLPRLGFWCVPAIAHLAGVRTCALRPDTLYRHCLAQGGEVIDGW